MEYVMSKETTEYLVTILIRDELRFEAYVEVIVVSDSQTELLNVIEENKRGVISDIEKSLPGLKGKLKGYVVNSLVLH